MSSIKKYALVLFAATFSIKTLASTYGITLDPNGNTVPIPDGNIPYFKMPNALAANPGEFTWDYSGTLSNANQDFSIQANELQVLGPGEGGLGIGFHIFDFGFTKGNSYFFSNSDYGGEEKENEALANSLDWLTSTATFKQLDVSITSMSNPANHWSFTTAGRVPQPPLYQGWVGQPGHEYLLQGTGATYLWQFDKTSGKHKVAPYTYTFSIKVLDTRGATMEGWGGGYTGPNIASMKPTGKPYANESEIAQPRLKVLSWSVTIKTNNTQAGFQPSYQFSGNSGMLWDDFGPVVTVNPAKAVFQSELTHLIAKILPTDKAAKLHHMTLPHKNGPAGQYDGNWLPVQFTSGKYKGATLACVLTWNTGSHHGLKQSTKYYDWSKYGWCNFYSGIIPNKINSATSLTEPLYAMNPNVPTRDQAASEGTFFDISIDKYIDSKFGQAYPWSKEVTITIKPNTPLRFALASYADQLTGTTTADDPNQPISIKLSAISPVTQDTFFSKNVTQFYEGAAIPTINGVRVGYGWIENMY